MNPILNKASRNFLFHHPWQLVLAILGITLGVAVVVSIDLALDSSLNSFTQTTQALSGKSTHRILASDGGLDENLYRSLRVKHGIQQLSPTVNGYVTLLKPNTSNSNSAKTNSANSTEITFKLHGIDPLVESSFQPTWQQDNNTGNGLRLITEPNTVLMNRQTANNMGLNLGDRFTVRSDTGNHQLTVIGWLPEDKAISTELLDNVLITDIATAQECLGLLGKLSSINLILDLENAPKRQFLEEAIPNSVLLIPLENQAESLKQMTHAFSINLSAMGLLSLLVGMFLIYNTMTFLVIQRRGLIGSLRSIGVTRKQIFHLIIGEALILAFIGTVLGIVSGILLGQGLLQLISGTINHFFFQVDGSRLMVSPLPIVKGGLLGIGATLLAVLAPAWEATRQSPHRTMIRSQLESGSHRLIKAAAVVALIFILCSLLLILLSEKNVSLGLTSIFLMLFGFALWVPWFTLRLMKLLEALLFGSSSILARFPLRLVSAEISRTGTALATLMIAVSVSIGMDLMIGSFRLTVSEWLQTSLQADLYVSLSGKNQLADKPQADQQLKANIAALNGVEMLSNVLHTQLIQAQSKTSSALTPVAVFELNNKSKDGFIFKKQIDDVWDSFVTQNTVFVTEPYAYHHNIQIDDMIKLRTNQGDKAFKVTAIYADYSGDQGHLAMSRDIFQKYWPDQGYTGIGIYIKEAMDSQELEAQVKPLLKPYQTIKSEQAIYRASMKMFEQTFKITEVLRWLAAGIAFVGVFSALMALQFERTRQLGTLRAIGMTPGQLARLIGIETGLMGLVAGLFAVPVGLAMAYVLIFVVYQRSFGWTMAYHFDAGIVLQGVFLAFIAALLAGVLPALKMAQTNPAQALRSE